MEPLRLAKSIIDKFTNILIYPSPDLQGDSLGSALALFYTLKKIGKNVNINIKDTPEKFRFLTNPLPAGGDFVISINTEGKDISKMRYEKNHKDLKIYLAMNKGEIRRDDINFSLLANAEDSGQNTGLLISVGIPSLEAIPQLFWKSAILNIDNQPQNENFGEVNLVETTSSLSEITSNLIRLMCGEEIFDEKTATCLLTGIICSSQNFRSPRTRPKTFETSAFLIEKGANHQEIVQHLYKQKSLSQIKLLGKVLEKLDFNDSKEIYSSLLQENDFKECQANSKDLAFVLEELKFHFRRLPNLLILWESHASPAITKGVFYSPNSGLPEKILENFEGVSRGNSVLFLSKETNLTAVQEKILNIL